MASTRQTTVDLPTPLMGLTHLNTRSWQIDAATIHADLRYVPLTIGFRQDPDARPSLSPKYLTQVYRRATAKSMARAVTVAAKEPAFCERAHGGFGNPSPQVVFGRRRHGECDGFGILLGQSQP